jgi:RimJ/RimL family protein N-acetyltransferase
LTLELTDGVIILRPRTLADVDQQVAGQDVEIMTWLDWEAPTPENVSAMISSSIEAFGSGVLRFDLGVYDAGTGAMVGNGLANFADPLLQPGEVNIAYAVFPAWRRRGIATRVVELLCQWLCDQPDAHTAVLKIDAGNAASHAVARRSGFVRSGVVEAAQAQSAEIRGPSVVYDRYVREVSATATAI